MDYSSVDRSVSFHLGTGMGPMVDVMFKFGDGPNDNTWGLDQIEVEYEVAAGRKKAQGSALASFFILFMFFFSLYCCIGMGYKKFVVKAEGVDVLPNTSFWVGVGRGCGNLGNTIRSKCSRTPSGYSAASLEPPEYDF